MFVATQLETVLYDNLILLDDEFTYIRTGTEETSNIEEITFEDESPKITIKDIRRFLYQIFADPVSYDALKGLYGK